MHGLGRFGVVRDFDRTARCAIFAVQIPAVRVLWITS